MGGAERRRKKREKRRWVHKGGEIRRGVGRKKGKGADCRGKLVEVIIFMADDEGEGGMGPGKFPGAGGRDKAEILGEEKIEGACGKNLAR